MNHVVRLELPATHDAVRVARHMVRHFARLHAVPEAERDTLVLVASELLSNAVDHGGGGAALDESQLLNGARMLMELHVVPGRWQLAVSDEGGGDPRRFRELLSKTELPDLDDDRGRGLYLMRTTVDRLDVSKSADGKGLCITAVRERYR